jgi:hypothetical protein
MAAPEGDGASVRHVRYETGCLRIVQDDDVPGPNASDQVLSVLSHDSVINLACVFAERRSVSEGSMERVMEAFGHGEEVVHAVEDEPAGVDARTTHVREQYVEHLRNAAADSGGVDVPDDAALKSLAQPFGSSDALVERLRVDEL